MPLLIVIVMNRMQVDGIWLRRRGHRHQQLDPNIDRFAQIGLAIGSTYPRRLAHRRAQLAPIWQVVSTAANLGRNGEFVRVLCCVRIP
jgi:hypothetical protein